MAEDLAIRQILEVIQPHPCKICAALLFLVATVEETIVALVESLVPLVEVDHLVVDLWLEIVQFVVAIGFCF